MYHGFTGYLTGDKIAFDWLEENVYKNGINKFFMIFIHLSSLYICVLIYTTVLVTFIIYFKAYFIKVTETEMDYLRSQRLYRRLLTFNKFSVFFTAKWVQSGAYDINYIYLWKIIFNFLLRVYKMKDFLASGWDISLILQSKF